MLKKYSITALFSLLLIFAAFTGGTFAEAIEPTMSPEIADALAQVIVVNDKIYVEISKVQNKAEKMHADYLAEVAKTTDTQKQVDAWEKYDVKVEQEITALQSKTEAMTLKGMEIATANRLVVEMEWIPVNFADRVRMIDPIKVVGW